MFYPNLMKLFHQLINSMTIEQKNELKISPDKFVDSIVSHFKIVIDTETNNEYLLEEIFKYQEEFSFEQIYFLTNPNDRATAITDIYIHYIQKRIEPDKNLGICLFETQVAGTNYISEISEKINAIQNGDILNIIWEKNNPFDENALKVIYDNQKFGYIPKDKNKNLIFLLNQNYKLFAVLKRVVWNEHQVKIKILVYIEKQE